MFNRREGQSRRVREKSALPIERLPLAYIVLDRDHRVNEWNPAAEHIFGYSKQEVLGKNCLDLLVPAPRSDHVQEIVRRVWHGDPNAHSVNENRTKDGRTITCEWSNTPIWGPHGKVKGVICLGRDITASKCTEQMLESTQRRYQAIFQYALDAILLWDNSGHLVDGNPSACELTGYSHEELVKRHVLDLVPKAEREKILGGLQDFRSPATRSGEGLLLRKDRETRRIEYRAVAEIFAGLHLVVLHDITESCWAKQELELQAEVLQTIFDHIPVMIKFVDRERRIQFVNQHFENVLYSSEQKHHSQNTTDDVGSFYALPKRSLLSQKRNLLPKPPLELTFKAKSRGGRILHVSWATVALSDGSCISFAQDITAQRQAEIHLRESEERFRQLAENIDGYFWLSSADGQKLYYLSPGYERICGRSCDSLYERPRSWTEILHPDDRKRVLAETHRPIGCQGRHLEYRIILPDGAVRWIRDRAFAVLDASGQVSRVAGIGEDITERKQSEDALHEFASRLQELSRRVVEVQEQERRHLARELHDEIGQVLSTIRLNLSANLEDCNRATKNKLEDSIAIVDKAIHQVRNLSLDLRPAMLDDLGLVATLRWSADRQAQGANFKLAFDAESTGERLPADLEIACYRVAQEALTNIARHARARNVSFTFRQHHLGITIVIRDDGVGFDITDVRQRIAQGASFGLRGMQERANLLGGTLGVTSSPGTGTKIHLQLPFGSDQPCPPSKDELFQ